jgi:hypothetical protein
MIRRLIRPGARYRYGLLLGLISASIAFQLAASASNLARFVIVLLQGVTLVLALWTSRANPILVRIAAAAVIVAFAASAIALVSGGDAGADTSTIVSLLLVLVAPVVVAAGVVRGVREERTVSLATMFGVLCLYLLVGMSFAFVYGAIDRFGSGEFFAESIDPITADFLYYSFATLTTTGFGDLTAATGLGRAVTIAEALFGQVYLVTVVAAIVSNLRPRQP